MLYSNFVTLTVYLSNLTGKLLLEIILDKKCNLMFGLFLGVLDLILSSISVYRLGVM